MRLANIGFRGDLDYPDGVTRPPTHEPKHRGALGRPKGPLRFPNANPHRDKYTEMLVNMSPCPACIRHLKQRGLHRRHKRCLGQTVGQTVVIMCDCECRRMSTELLQYIADHPMGMN